MTTDTSIGRDTCAPREPSAREKYEAAVAILAGLGVGTYSERAWPADKALRLEPYRRAMVAAVVQPAELPELARRLAAACVEIGERIGTSAYATIHANHPFAYEVSISVSRPLDPDEIAALEEAS